MSAKGKGSDLWVVVAIVALVAGLFFYFNANRQQALRSSPIGFDGLQVWLTHEDIPARNFTGGWPIEKSQVGLLIVPLFDTDLLEERAAPRTKEDLLFQQDEVDATRDDVLAKIEAVPTLVVLPKWRTGMRLTGLAHPALLVEAELADDTLSSLTVVPRGALSRSRQVFTGFAYDDALGQEIEIYAAQTIQSPLCVPIIGTQDAMLLAQCGVAQSDASVFVLSDPDFLNNHGLRLGDNAQMASRVINTLRADGEVIIDYSRQSWFIDAEQGVERDRTWDDLRRFFEPPFVWLWLAGALVLSVALWRGGVRGGPVRGAHAHAAKETSIAARARLLRLSDQDGALVGAYTSARLGHVAAALLGPAEGRAYGSDPAFQRFVTRRYPHHADALRDTLTTIRNLPAHISARDAAAHIDALETVLEDIINDT